MALPPMSPQARATLEAFRRDQTVDAATLQRARQALTARLAQQMPGLSEPVARDDTATPSTPVRGSTVLRMPWFGGFAVLLVGLVSVAALRGAKPGTDWHEPTPRQSDNEPLAPLAPTAPTAPTSPAVPTAPTARVVPPVSTRAPNAPPASSSASPLPAAPRSTVESPAATRRATPRKSPRSGAATKLSSGGGAEPSSLDLLAPTASGVDSASPSSARQVGRPPPATPVSDAPESAPTLSLDAEVRLIRQAYDMLSAREPVQAWSTLEEHARLFPHGKLRELRDVARVLALCDRGQVARARLEVQTFLRRYPSSIHASRVRGTCTAH